MTIAERNNKLKHFIACLKCEVSGKVCDDNCPTQYNAGNMGEIIENLEAISKALEQEPVLDRIKEDFIARYPRNYANELELGGRSCVFSLNDILHTIDKYKAESEEI